MMMMAGPREKSEVIRKRNLQGFAGDRHSHLAMAIHHLSCWSSHSPTGLFATGLRMFLLGTFRRYNLWGGT